MRYVLLLVPLAACWRLDVVEDDYHPIHGDPDAYVPPDAAACSVCTADQLCVEFFDGTCGYAGVKCMPITVSGCHPSAAACSAECEQAYCKPENELFQCAYRNGCNPDPNAFTCYGP